MEYEKKYKDALKWIESIYTELSHEIQMEAEAFFPELKESVDERIRKELIKGFQHYDKECKWGGFTTTEILAWLEKQGEHKTDFRERYSNIAQSEWFKETYEDKSATEEDDKPTHKFKVGDWITSVNGHSYLIASVDDNRYLFEIGGYTHEQLNWEYIENADNRYHLWTVQDVNAGDVLVCESNHGQAIGIVKDYVGKQGGCDSCFDTYCFVDWDGRFRVGGYMGSRNIHPATKEQRDTLNKVLKKEQGLVYNFAKKKLTKADDIATTVKEQSDVYETRGY